MNNIKHSFFEHLNMLLFHSDRMNKGSVSALTMNPDFTENRNISIPSYFYISGFSGIPHMRYYYIFLFDEEHLCLIAVIGMETR